MSVHLKIVGGALTCAASQSQQYQWLALTPNLLRLVLRTQPRSWPTAKFTDNLWMYCLML